LPFETEPSFDLGRRVQDATLEVEQWPLQRGDEMRNHQDIRGDDRRFYRVPDPSPPSGGAGGQRRRPLSEASRKRCGGGPWPPPCIPELRGHRGPAPREPESSTVGGLPMGGDVQALALLFLRDA